MECVVRCPGVHLLPVVLELALELVLACELVRANPVVLLLEVRSSSRAWYAGRGTESGFSVDILLLLDGQKARSFVVGSSWFCSALYSTRAHRDSLFGVSRAPTSKLF